MYNKYIVSHVPQACSSTFPILIITNKKINISIQNQYYFMHGSHVPFYEFSMLISENFSKKYLDADHPIFEFNVLWNSIFSILVQFVMLIPKIVPKNYSNEY